LAGVPLKILGFDIVNRRTKMHRVGNKFAGSTGFKIGPAEKVKRA
jgi:hypothetical protein